MGGWMRILGAEVGAAFPIVNLHPALPGQFPGLRSIERAHEAWRAGEISATGAMVHWVPDDGVDVGPVVATAEVPFVRDESLADFETRFHTVEHELIVRAVGVALEQLANGVQGSAPNGSPSA